MPTDGAKMNVDYSSLQSPSETVGLGGLAGVNLEPAVVVFTDPGKNLYCYQIDLEIIRPSQYLVGLPSLLGRDILNNWRMRYSPVTRRLSFFVHRADDVLPID